MGHLSVIKAFAHDHNWDNRNWHTADFVIGIYFLNFIYALHDMGIWKKIKYKEYGKYFKSFYYVLFYLFSPFLSGRIEALQVFPTITEILLSLVQVFSTVLLSIIMKLF